MGTWRTSWFGFGLLCLLDGLISTYQLLPSLTQAIKSPREIFPHRRSSLFIGEEVKYKQRIFQFVNTPSFIHEKSEHLVVKELISIRYVRLHVSNCKGKINIFLEINIQHSLNKKFVPLTVEIYNIVFLKNYYTKSYFSIPIYEVGLKISDTRPMKPCML